MRTMLTAIVVLGMAGAPALAVAAPISTGAVAKRAPAKNPGPIGMAQPPGIQVGGDNFANATVIPSLPYTDTGNTCGFADDYDPPCATTDPFAPDVVYAFRAPRDMCVNASLCGSSYDTVLYVYDSETGGVIACNDDFCAVQSQVSNVSLTGGVLYYIVVDGWGRNCGDYSLAVSECPPPCEMSCPPDAVVENEPDCSDGYVDSYNGGCNSTPAVFSDAVCNDAGVSICGRYGNYLSAEGLPSRDTDWYRIVLDHAVTLQVCACAQGDFQILILDGNHGCPLGDADILASATTMNSREQICCSAALGPGTFYLWAGALDFAGVACGSQYVLTLTGYECPPVGVTPAKWGSVKALYR